MPLSVLKVQLSTVKCQGTHDRPPCTKANGVGWMELGTHLIRSTGFNLGHATNSGKRRTAGLVAA